jgi:hypothetical protein
MAYSNMQIKRAAMLRLRRRFGLALCALPAEAWRRMDAVPGLRVINNSWGIDIFADQSKDFDTGQKYSTFYYTADFLKAWLHGTPSDLVDAAL